jgi:hypothetical protein
MEASEEGPHQLSSRIDVKEFSTRSPRNFPGFFHASQIPTAPPSERPNTNTFEASTWPTVVHSKAGPGENRDRGCHLRCPSCRGGGWLSFTSRRERR